VDGAATHPLVSFYRDGARDGQGRTLSEILAWRDDDLEDIHDFIQWLFPLPERSGANPTAPTLNPEVIAAFRSTPAMRERLRQALDRMLAFYGLAWDQQSPMLVIVRAPGFPERADNWLRPMNHNHLRLTRILRSTLLLGLEAESKALFDALNAIYREFPTRISARTHAFWSDAATGTTQAS
jgi:Opioid growth factor receptor (OGFr) conserved region